MYMILHCAKNLGVKLEVKPKN